MRRGTAFVLLSAFLWGTTFPAVRYGLEAGALPPFAFVYYRFVVATLVLLGVAIYLKRVRFELFRDWTLVGLGLVNALGYVLQFVAQERTTASKTALLVNVNVLLTVLLAFYFLRERYSRGTLWGIGAGVLGVGLLTTNGDLGALRFSNEEFLGDLFAFGTGVCWTIYILAIKAHLNRRPDTDVVALTVVVFTVTTLALFPLALLTDGLAYTGNTIGLVAILYLGIFPTTGAFLLWQHGLKTTSAAVSSVLLLFENFVALALSIAFLGEQLTGWTAVGALLILAAIVLASSPAEPTLEPTAVGPGPSGPAEPPTTVRGDEANAKT